MLLAAGARFVGHTAVPQSEGRFEHADPAPLRIGDAVARADGPATTPACTAGSPFRELQVRAHQPAINITRVEAIQPIMYFYAFCELLADSSEVTRMNRDSILFLRNMPVTDSRRFLATENHQTGTIP